MRICLYTETALPKLGGQEMVVDALARQYCDMGHDVVVFAPHPRRPLRANDRTLPYPVVRHPRFYSTRHFVDWYRWFLLRLHRSHRFDVLHCHGVYPPAYLAALCGSRLPVPVAITSHGGDVREGNVRLAKPVVYERLTRALAAADALIAISKFTETAYRRLCPQARSIVTIPNGVDLGPFASAVTRPEGLDAAVTSKGYVLFLGRLKTRKGVDVLLSALSQVPAKDVPHLIIAGQGEEQPVLEAQAARLGLAERVRFVGPVSGSTKTYLLQNALCTIMPSRVWEAFPLVVLESYAAGAPVLATRVPGLEDLVQPNETGMLVPAEQPAALANALSQLLGDRTRLQQMGERARQIAQEYGWDNIARRHLRLYEELITAKHRASRAA